MRGALHASMSLIAVSGIIPAYAGSTGYGVSRLPMTADHPRVCGEHSVYPTEGQVYRGSSPRMRGAQRVLHHPVAIRRIIPAYAGSTNWRQAAMWQYTDHPRVCGEHQGLSSDPHHQRGSSPRMRGALCTLSSGYLSVRIIPAHAGSTRSVSSGFWCNPDHPRVCGEHFSRWLRLCHHLGSSPRMRGAPCLMRKSLTQSGIIPAYAGSTVQVSGRQHIYGDHPRVCGEHT